VEFEIRGAKRMGIGGSSCVVDHTEHMESDPIAQARDLFLTDDNAHGCAEATYITLKTAFGLPEADDSSAAMALNGGLAYSGGICGAISGAALAVGQLAGARIADHNEAKTTARETMMEVMDAFEVEFGSTTCRGLLGLDLRKPGEHDRFIESGIWQTGCMRQIEFAVQRLADLDRRADWGSGGSSD
jgi:C_GCAxxG_C_C family probable redox protein